MSYTLDDFFREAREKNLTASDLFPQVIKRLADRGDPEAIAALQRVAGDDLVICPACTHQFRAIPVNVQALLLAAGYEPPFFGELPVGGKPLAVGDKVCTPAGLKGVVSDILHVSLEIGGRGVYRAAELQRS